MYIMYIYGEGFDALSSFFYSFTTCTQLYLYSFFSFLKKNTSPQTTFGLPKNIVHYCGEKIVRCEAEKVRL
jgi:hypothetical protein